MYSREDTVKMLLARKADPTTLGGPKAQSSVHLVCSRPTSQALQILRALMTVAPKDARLKQDAVRKKKDFAHALIASHLCCRIKHHY